MYKEINLAPKDDSESLENIVLEKIQVAIEEVIKNVTNVNTDYKPVREVKLSIKFKIKDETREKIVTSVSSKVNLAPVRTSEKVISLVKDRFVESIETNMPLFDDEERVVLDMREAK